jgi:hypothetical protein
MLDSNNSFARTTLPSSAPAFVVDRDHLVRDTGRQIDWDLLDKSFVPNPQIVKLNGAAAPGAVSLTVDALPIALNVGDVLNFGVLEQVTVTIGVAGATANDTTIPVAALSGPIPDNTLLDFGGKKFARVNGAVAAGATSITVDAIPTNLVSGDVATFEGGELLAYVDAHAAKGATSVTVEDLEYALADNAEAIMPGGFGSGDEMPAGAHLKAGTIVDLLASGKVVPSSINSGGGVTAYGILATNTDQYSETDASTGYGIFTSGSFFENLLPDAENASLSTWKTELLARGGFWMFDTYADNT